MKRILADFLVIHRKGWQGCELWAWTHQWIMWISHFPIQQRSCFLELMAERNKEQLKNTWVAFITEQVAWAVAYFHWWGIFNVSNMHAGPPTFQQRRLDIRFVSECINRVKDRKFCQSIVDNQHCGDSC